MTAGIHDITIEQNADFERNITWNDADCEPVDITGFAIKMQIRGTSYSAAIITLGTVEGGIEITDAAAGQFSITISAADTANMTEAYNMVYDVLVTRADMSVVRLIQGSVDVTAGITT